MGAKSKAAFSVAATAASTAVKCAALGLLLATAPVQSTELQLHTASCPACASQVSGR